MNKLKLWLAQRFLPALLYRDLMDENEHLRIALLHERSHSNALRAQIKGINMALRHCGAKLHETEEAPCEQSDGGVFRRDNKT